MADLFDMNMGGSGWHITSHLIAIVALFVACFAITGYITYRDNTIPAGAIEGGIDFADEDITAASLTSLSTVSAASTVTYGALTQGTVQAVSTTIGAALNTDVQLAQPANTFIKSLYISPSASFVTAANNTDDFQMTIGNVQGGGQIMAATLIMDGPGTQLTTGYQYPIIRNGVGIGANLLLQYGDAVNPANSAATVMAAGAPLATLAARTVWVRFAPLNNALVTGGTITVTLEYEQLS